MKRRTKSGGLITLKQVLFEISHKVVQNAKISYFLYDESYKPLQNHTKPSDERIITLSRSILIALIA